MRALIRYEPGQIDQTMLIVSIMTGFVQALAILVIYHSIVNGYAGPAVALSGLNPLHATILTAMTSGPVPNLNQVFSMLVGILGCAIISVGPLIHDNFIKKLPKKTKTE